MAEIWRARRELPAGELALIMRIKVLAEDRRNALEIKRIAYLPLGAMSPAREYAWCVCQLKRLGNLAEVRRLDRKEAVGPET